MTIKNFFQTMTDGLDINVNRWIPDSEPKAIILISHGMAEHSLRYDKVASYFTDAGFLVSAHDHRGHGKTAQKQIEKGEPGFGYLADKNGYLRATEDIIEIANKLKEEFPNKKIILIGHSFGSFLSQNLIENNSNCIDQCILLGTRGPMLPIVKVGYALSNILYFFGLKKKQSNLMDNLMFNGYNSKIKNSRTKFDWLTKDNFIVDMYLADQWCGFKMKTEFYHELLKMLKTIHKSKNIKKIPAELPIFIATGKDDPVGSYGKTVEKLFNIYKSNGIKDVELKLYENDRHELLNETDSEQVINDIIDWINKRV